MAFNEILVGRLNRYVQKLLMIKNTALRSLSPDLICTMQIQNGVEDRYLQGWQRFMFTTTQAAVAAANSAVELRSAPNSGILLVVEKATVLPAATSLVQMVVQKNSSDLAGGVLALSQNRIDSRSNPSPSAIASTGTAAIGSIGASVFRMLSSSTAPFELILTLDQEVTILPGDAFFLIDETVNQQCSFSIMWRERVLESSELS